MSKREENSKETKQKIFKAAARLFALQGFAGTSMRVLAKEAEVNLALINYHFKDKQQLFNAVFEHGLEKWSQMLESQRGNDMETILRHLMAEATNTKGTAYYMSIFMRMFIDSSVESAYKESLILSGPPNGEVLEEAVAKELGRDITEKEVKVVSHYLVSNLILSSRIKFGLTPKTLKRAYVARLFPEGSDPHANQLVALGKSLCAQYKKS